MGCHLQGQTELTSLKLDFSSNSSRDMITEGNETEEIERFDGFKGKERNHRRNEE